MCWCKTAILVKFCRLEFSSDIGNPGKPEGSCSIVKRWVQLQWYAEPYICSSKEVGIEKSKITRKVGGVIENRMIWFIRAMTAPHNECLLLEKYVDKQKNNIQSILESNRDQPMYLAGEKRKRNNIYSANGKPCVIMPTEFNRCFRWSWTSVPFLQIFG